MKKLLALLLVVVCISNSVLAQQHKIVFDLTSDDTAVQAHVFRQLNSILKEAPDAELEIVCFSSALLMLVKDKTTFEERIKELKLKGKVNFKACANTMRRMGIDKSQIISSAEIVPMAVLELSAKQREGWSYLKVGY